MNSWAQGEGQPGLGYIFWREGEEGGAGPLAKNIGPERTKQIADQMKLGIGDACFFVAGKPKDFVKFAGPARAKIGEELGLIDKGRFEFCWIVDFPMYEWNEEEKTIDFSHNPFSMPNLAVEEFLALDAKDNDKLLSIKAIQYDIVCNGVELSSGAIRNHRPEVMKKAFAIAGYSEDVLENKFGGMVCTEVGPAFGRRPDLRISFNFAGKLFSEPSIVKDVRDIFASSPIKFSQVVLEVTERDPIENFTETRQTIAALQGLGVRIAIDDVGTGHSGLSYMLKLGVDIIKIDKMFVDAIGTDRNSTTIVETLVDLARNMRMDVVAEGVENFEQVMHLRTLGVRAAQGYVFAPPLPGSSFLQLVEALDPLQPAGLEFGGAERMAMSA